MLGLALALSPGSCQFSVGYSESQVKASAGVTPGVTPGYTGSPGVTATARTQRAGLASNAGWPQASGTNTSWSWSTRAELLALITAAQGSVTGDGTEANPYLIQNWNPYGFTAANNDTVPVFNWDAAADADPYWVKLTNIQFGTGLFNTNKVGDVYCNAPTGGGMIVENCTSQGTASLEAPANDAHYVSVRGTLRLNLCALTGSFNGWVRKIGANGIVEITDCLVDASGSAWVGASGVLRNSAAGGSLTVTRCTFDYAAQNYLLVMTNNCAVTLTRVLWNASQNIACRSLLPTVNTTVTEAWTAGFTMTDCRFYTGDRTNTNCLIGAGGGVNNQSLQNWTIVHCEFLATATFGAAFNEQLITLGPSVASGAEHTKNIKFLFCRFALPQAVKVVAGNEVIYFMHVSDVRFEGCWVNACGEDAYEFQEPYRNCVVRYCGGGEVSGSYVGGNVVDFYGAGAVWNAADGNTGGHQAHHIWGACRGDAVVCDSVHGTTIRNIDVDNVVGGFVANPPASNVRLHARAAAPLDNVIVSVPLTNPSLSFNGKPCELTYENAGVAAACGTTPGTVIWQEWNGSSFDTRGGADGIVDGM